MKKFLKWFLIILLAIFGLITLLIIVDLHSSVDEYNHNSQTENKKNKIHLSKPTDLKIDIKLKDTDSQYRIIGKTNLPDSTKISIDFIVGDNIKGQTSTFVEFGKFEFLFGKKLINIDSIEISCINNIHWQTPSVLKQLIFLNNLSDKGSISKKFLTKGLKREFFSNILDYQQPENLKLTTPKIKDVISNNCKKIVVDLMVDKAITDKELEKHIKYWTIEELVKDSEINAITVRCFHKGEDITFRPNAVFAPYGDWSKASEQMKYSDYTFKI